MSLIKTIDYNAYNNIYVVGDIHGCAEDLRVWMKDVGFNKAKDLMISVGDLIDRGPDSVSSALLVGQDWFEAVLGNHEKMFLDAMWHREVSSYGGDTDFANLNSHMDGNRRCMLANGGAWVFDVDHETRVRIHDNFRDLPYVIEVKDGDRVVAGILHGDIPQMSTRNWMTLKDMVLNWEDAGFMNNILDTIIWGRDLYNLTKAWMEFAPVNDRKYIYGVEKIYIGHTPTNAPLSYRNYEFIDSGHNFHRNGLCIRKIK